MKKKYSLYCLTLELPFAFPELRESSDEADVVVLFGSIDHSEIEWKQEGICHKAAPGAYFLSLEGIADYLVRDGREITIEPAPDSDEGAIKLFLISAAIGSLMIQRGFLLLQGSCVVHEGKAFALLGGSSEGKSFLAAGLMQKGFQVLSDNLCIVGNDETPMVYPEHPNLLLWKQGLKLLKEDDTGLKPVRKGLLKFYFPLGENSGAEPVPLHGIYFLQNRRKEEFRFEELSGPDKFYKILDFTYHEPLVLAMKAIKHQHMICSKITKSASGICYTFLDAKDVFQQSINTLAEHIKGVS